MIKLGVIYGGTSTEKEVSQMSAKSVIDNLDKEKYDIQKIFIGADGKWYDDNNERKEISNYIEVLKNLDVVFPVLHGKYGEDGTIQGLFEMVGVPYVGCGVLASSVGMDKVYTKVIFEKAGLNQAPYVYVKENNEEFKIVSHDFEEEEFDLDKIEKQIKYPMFVKPSSSGSSVGVKRATNREELKLAILHAAKFDSKILVEQGIEGKEVECAILEEKGTVTASTVGEVQAAESFYSYDAKYNIPESKTIIPAHIAEDLIEEIRKLASKAFKAIDGKGLARVDFFIENETKKIYINEINTMPGFTNISMYPMLFNAVGIGYSELLDRLVESAIK